LSTSKLFADKLKKTACQESQSSTVTALDEVTAIVEPLILCVDKINRSMNAHNFRHDVVNLLETTTPTQPREIGENNLNIWQYSVLVYHPSAFNEEEEKVL